MANPDSQESKYWKLMNELKQKIVDDTYQAGDKMPSENELAAFYQVSRHTVRKAPRDFTRGIEDIFMQFTAKEHFVQRWDVIQRHLVILLL